MDKLKWLLDDNTLKKLEISHCIAMHLCYTPTTHYAEQSKGPYGELSPLMNEWMDRWNAAHSFLSDILPPFPYHP